MSPIRTAGADDAIEPRDRAAWRAWLMRHHDRGAGVWVILSKKASGRAGLAYEELVEEALCFGWIDSKPNKLDARANARRHFDAFPPSVRRSILEWILNAKRPETRAARISETARLAERNQRANQWRGRGDV